MDRFIIQAAHNCGPDKWDNEFVIEFNKGETDSNLEIVGEIIDLLNENDFRDCTFRLEE